jgi:hypothetical protein
VLIRRIARQSRGWSLTIDAPSVLNAGTPHGGYFLASMNCPTWMAKLG